MDISDWRKKIDELDRKLVELLSQRAQAAHEIGRLKRDAGMPIYEPDRERKVFDNVRGVNRALCRIVTCCAFTSASWMSCARSSRKKSLRSRKTPEPGATPNLDNDVND